MTAVLSTNLQRALLFGQGIAVFFCRLGFVTNTSVLDW